MQVVLVCWYWKHNHHVRDSGDTAGAVGFRISQYKGTFRCRRIRGLHGLQIHAHGELLNNGRTSSKLEIPRFRYYTPGLSLLVIADWGFTTSPRARLGHEVV